MAERLWRRGTCRTRRRLALAALLWLATGVGAAYGEDLVEFLSGRQLEGRVVEIRKETKEFDFAFKIGNKPYNRTFKFSVVHAVTMNGKRYELSPKISNSATTPGASSDASKKPASRTPREVERLIETAGATPPDWWDETSLDYPQSLDLSWPLKPPQKGWNNQKNMGQYIWDIINPNPSRWRGGIKLVHHCMTLHQGKPELLKRDMTTLGRMYFTLLQDYPRAAYWFQKARVEITTGPGVKLAECYWRMGSKPMALKMLEARQLPASAIKLYGDMGDVDRALQLANSLAKTDPANGYMLGADALRSAGQGREAIAYYKRVLTAKEHRNADYERRIKSRARDSIAAIELEAKADIRRVADGSYRGQADAYNGPLEVQVTVADGKIQAVSVSRHNEKQFYSAIEDTTRQILEKQGVRRIDGTTGATITSQAIVNAAARALANGAQ